MKQDEEQSYTLQHGCGVAWYAIDYCLMKMKEGEMSRFELNFEQTKATFVLTLHSFVKAAETWKMTIPEKHTLALEMKSLGTNLLKRNNFSFAAEKYGLALKLLLSDGCRAIPEDSHAEKANSVRMNLSLCFMKLEMPEAVIYHCNSVISSLEKEEISELDSPSVDRLIKSLYRRAWAFLQINEYAKSRADIDRIMEMDGNNCEAEKLSVVLGNKIKIGDQKMSVNLKNLFR